MTTEKAAEVESTDVQYEALEYVYCGRRWSVSEKLLISVRPIKDGELLREMLFDFDRKMVRSVGGVYSGASFHDNGARGLSSANRFERLWQDKSDLIDWQVKDENVEIAARSKKLESDSKKVSEIEKILLPLRQQYESYRVKRDLAGMAALSSAVQRALQAAPRTSE
jgi:hypothetical protein